jgi:hypothetical protein
LFNSAVLDVAIGMIFVFLAVSLAASAVTEAIAGLFNLRSNTLLLGIKDLLNDPNFNALAAQIYQHALVNPQNNGAGTTEAALTVNAPAYVQPMQFANALIDILDTGKPNISTPPGGHPGRMVGGNIASITAAINYVVPAAANPQINSMLLGLVNRTGGDIAQMKQEISAWFDNSMDRLSGFYKRRTQLINFFAALILAGVLNISAIHVAKVLWLQPIDTRVVDNAAKDTLRDPLTALETLNKLPLPIGWDHYNAGSPGLASWNPPALGDYPEMLFGWLITAAGTVFGAPFWFDTLQRVVRLKAAGPSPKEKQTDTAAAG